MVLVLIGVVTAVGLDRSTRSGIATDKITQRPITNTVPRSYLDMHMHYAVANGMWPPISFGSWQMSDTDMSWADLDTARDDWRFERMDSKVRSAEAPPPPAGGGGRQLSTHR